MPFAFLCDFDGTVAPADIGATFVEKFGFGDRQELATTLARWKAGEVGHRELTRVECRRIRVTEPEARAFASSFGLDPGFGPFAREADRKGHVVAVASEGFDFYIADLLRREGLPHVPYAANRLRFEAGGVVPEFPHTGGCGRCGNCKGARVRDQRASGRTVVMVGDGLSDRCGAREADYVLARGDLLDWCRTQGIAADPFESFADVARWASARWDVARAMEEG
jgi:2-hydroxy-3-keto-5-methylthiopentenyl-1-phosphate phosphatase